MNAAFPDQIYNGICLCISLQMIAIGVYKTYAKQNRIIILGVLYAILGSTFLNNLFYPAVRESTLLSILIGGGKQIFYAPLIYLYFALLNEQNKVNLIIRHLWFPLVFNLIYLSIKIFFPSIFYSSYFLPFTISTEIFTLSFYLYFGFLLFKNTTLSQLKPTIKKRYQFFYFGLVSYYFLMGSYMIILYLYPDFQSEQVYFFRNKYIFTPISIVVNTLLLYFAITETKQSKSLFERTKITIDKQKYDEFDITNLIQQYFYEEKIFVNANLTIDDATRTLQVPKNILRQYLKEELNTTFIQFINQLRVQEFKQRLVQEQHEMYSLTGIASMVGFQSKATFFRVFKQMEGMTPSEYQKAILN